MQFGIIAAMKQFLSKTPVIFIFFVVVLAGCVSAPKEIPPELTAQELIQKGQSAFENGKYKESLRYYNAVTERYADSLPLYIEASYEIGHLFMKQKKYDKAAPIFQEIVEIYANSAPGTLPGAYEKLAKLELAKIPE